MSVHSIRQAKEGAIRFGRQLWANTKGTASIELVLLTPMLLIFMVGTMEVSRAINVDKRINTVTSMTGDLIAREPQSMGGDPQGTLDAIMEAIAHVMTPYDSANLKLTVIPVKADAADASKTFIYATPYKYHGGVSGTGAKNTCYPMAANVMTTGSTVIVVKAEFAYEPMMVGFFDGWDFLPTMTSDDIAWDDTGVTTYTDESVHSPRTGCLHFENNNCGAASEPGGC